MTSRRRRLLPRWVRRLDRAANRRINASRSWHVHDRAYGRLSRIADNGALWYAVAAVVALVGHRRSAVRGLASALVAAFLSDVVVKKLFDGWRPLVDEVPGIRRLRAYPANPSFPSGHSASAAAFAVGVALESAPAGAMVAPLSAAVAYSRLHVGAHWLSDVLGGVALGAGVAALGRLLVPARTRRQPLAPEVEQVVDLIDLPPSSDGAGVLIVMNKNAGTSVIRLDPRPTIADRLPSARIRELEPDETMDDVVREIMTGEDPPLVLSVYGGDGSVSRMAHLALEYDVPFLPFPGGTFNHFSRTAGIETVDLAIDALQSGSGIAASVAELDDDSGRTLTVLNSASVGIYPEFLAQRTKRKPRLGKWIGGLAATWRELRDAEPIDVIIRGRRARVWSVFASVGRNTPGQVATFQRRTLSDDVLDVRVQHARGSRLEAVAALSFDAATRAVLRVLGLLPAASDIEHITATDIAISVHPRPGEATFYAHDGELQRRPPVDDDGRYTLTCRILPRALRVYAPAPSREEEVLDSSPR